MRLERHWKWFGCGSDMVRLWVGCGSDVFSDVFLDLVQTVWQKLRESGFQHAKALAINEQKNQGPFSVEDQKLHSGTSSGRFGSDFGGLPVQSAGHIHRVMRCFSAKTCPKQREMITSHDILEPLEQALLASRDVITSSQICGLNAQGKKNHTTNLEMAKSTRGAGGPNTGVQQAFPYNRNCLQLVLSEGLKTERNDRTRLVSPTASAKKMWCSAAEYETKSSGFWAKHPAKNVPLPFTRPLVVLDIFPPKKWFVFPAENSAKKCSASWQ